MHKSTYKSCLKIKPYFDTKTFKAGQKTTYVTKMDWQACPEKEQIQTKFNLVSSIKKVQRSYKVSKYT